MSIEDLRDYQQQFEAIKSDAQELLQDLSEQQPRWQPTPQQWSIAHCVDHIVVSGRSSLSNMLRAISEARSKGLLGQGPFQYRLIERWFVRQTEPPPRWRMKAPKAYAPSPDQPFAEIVSSFFALQDELSQCVEQANGIDLARVKVSNPVTKWIRFSLGQEIALNAAHERRHLWQARRVKEHRNFPRDSAAI